MKHTSCNNKSKSRLKITTNKTMIYILNPEFQSLEPYYNIMFDKTHIRIGNKYNCPIILFPNVIYISFGLYFNKSLELLNKTLQIIEMGDHFNKIIGSCQDPLPAKMKYLTVGCSYNKPLILSKNMVLLYFGKLFNHSIELTKHMEQFKTGNQFNKPLKLSKKMRVVVVGSIFNKPIILPKFLQHLSLGIKFNNPIILNTRIMYLEIDAGYMYNCVVEHLSHELCIRHGYNKSHVKIIDDLPNTLKQQIYLDFLCNPIPYSNLPNTFVQKYEYHVKHRVGKHGPWR